MDWEGAAGSEERRGKGRGNNNNCGYQRQRQQFNLTLHWSRRSADFVLSVFSMRFFYYILLWIYLIKIHFHDWRWFKVLKRARCVYVIRHWLIDCRTGRTFPLPSSGHSLPSPPQLNNNFSTSNAICENRRLRKWKIIVKNGEKKPEKKEKRHVGNDNSIAFNDTCDHAPLPYYCLRFAFRRLMP